MVETRIGTMGWSYDHWVGNFYPEGTDPGDYLSEYAKRFSSVEIDSTFYRIPYEETVEKWRRQTPNDFKFAAKFPRAITHGRKLGDDPGKLGAFIERVSSLGSKLGPLLLQFPPNFDVEKRDALRTFLENLPEGHLYAVEFRHRSWLNEKVYEMLRENNIALTLTGHPDMLMEHKVTSGFTYIRWQGERGKVRGDTGRVERDMSGEIGDWATRIRGFQKESIDVYGYFGKFYSGHPPSDARKLLESLS